jgi:hypothetical protein
MEPQVTDGVHPTTPNGETEYETSLAVGKIENLSLRFETGWEHLDKKTAPLRNLCKLFPV